MANEKRLIDSKALMDAFRTYMVERYDRQKCVSEENCKACDKPCLWRSIVSVASTVDAVPVSELKKLRDYLYTEDLIFMRGLAELNKLIAKYGAKMDEVSE